MRTLPTAFLVIILPACVQTETTAQTRTRSQMAATTQPRAQNPPATTDDTVVVAFDLPDGFESARAGSPNAVIGFRVGYFKVNERTATYTRDVRRDAVAVEGRTARLTLPSGNVVGCSGECSLKIQTLSSGNVSSAWSEPVRLSGQSAATAAATPPARTRTPRAARADRPRQDTTPRPARAARQRDGLNRADVESYPALVEALRALLPSDANLDEIVRPFRRAEDLAVAVAISRNYKIPFETVRKTLVGPPRLPIRSAVSKLRGTTEMRGVIQGLRVEAGKLLQPPAGQAPRTP